MIDKEKIIKLVSQGKIEDAINNLLHLTDFKEKYIILLSGQFQQWKENHLLGLDADKYSKRRIENAILNFLDTVNFDNTNKLQTKKYDNFVITRFNNLSLQIARDYELLGKLEKRISFVTNIKEREMLKTDIVEIKNLIKSREIECNDLIN